MDAVRGADLIQRHKAGLGETLLGPSLWQRIFEFRHLMMNGLFDIHPLEPPTWMQPCMMCGADRLLADNAAGVWSQASESYPCKRQLAMVIWLTGCSSYVTPKF